MTSSTTALASRIQADMGTPKDPLPARGLSRHLAFVLCVYVFNRVGWLARWLVWFVPFACMFIACMFACLIACLIGTHVCFAFFVSLFQAC